MRPAYVLMTEPVGFRVDYSINPYMIDDEGHLHRVDPERALAQWQDLRSLFESLDLQVKTLKGDPELPDMVFCANQTFPYGAPNGEASVVISKMKSEYRVREVPYYQRWAEENFMAIQKMDGPHFEGCGDALWNWQRKEVFGGYGPRTDRTAYDQLALIIKRPITTFELVHPHFYHLDTCLVMLTADKVAAVKEAFSPAGWHTLQNAFDQIIEIDLQEALTCFAGNAFCWNGRDVVLQKGAAKFSERLEREGFRIREVDTSEFIKAGGSVFCMKQLFYNY